MREFQPPQISAAERRQAVANAAAQVACNVPFFAPLCQNHSSVHNRYPACENNQWTCGFWPGELWLCYELTGDSAFAQAGSAYLPSFYARIVRKIEVDHHDMGFLYTPSCVAAYRLTGDETAKQAALLAADQLLARFQPVGEFLQAWGPLGAADNYRYIIDCLLNLPLLYWAGEVTGESRFSEIARRHLTTCLKYSFRPDGSSYHTVFMNPETGKMSHGATCQGYSDDSFWARGQAWAIYGAALSYRYTKKEEYLAVFRRALDFYLQRLPEDMVPYWDMIFTDGSGEPRDSSSAAIVACGLLEAAKYTSPEEAAEYEALAKQMLKSLFQSYAIQTPVPGQGLLLHGTYSKKSPYNTCTPEGVDEFVSWGDYFYLEALTRLSIDWKPYW